jgi:glycosyltransferase involved in cell wall biosynthesis
MRIGIEAQRIFRPKKHGMDVVAIELIKSLQEIDSKNEYVIFSRNGIDDKTIQGSSNFHIEKFPSFSYVDWEQIKLPKAVREKKLDVLHCTANTAPLVSSVPVVLTLHDIIYLEGIDFKGTTYQNLGNLYRKLLVPKIVNRANLILTVSQFEKNNIVQTLNLPQGKVKVLYNGVSNRFHTNFTEKQLQDFRYKYHLPAEYIMFLGNTAPKKNTLNVIKAYVDLCRERKNTIPLVLLDYRKEFVEKILADLKRPDLIEYFLFPGYIPHHKIPLMYHAASIFLYPSLRESFGLPILEAMACGVPVLTSNTSSMPEIAGDAAVLIDPFDYKSIRKGIESLLDDKNLRMSYKEKGSQRVKLFTWKTSAEKLISFYESFG